jgi:hypothetical protein
MVCLVNKALGKKVSYKDFNAIKNAFITDKNLTYGQVLEAFKKHPNISRNEVLRLFHREALVDPKVTIDGQAIFRTHLISLIESLESWTGRIMTDATNPMGPLEYLDGYTISIDDIAKYFSSGEGKIAHILKNKANAED